MDSSLKIIDNNDITFSNIQIKYLSKTSQDDKKELILSKNITFLKNEYYGKPSSDIPIDRGPFNLCFIDNFQFDLNKAQRSKKNHDIAMIHYICSSKYNSKIKCKC